jgi:hypothetical protein
MSPALPGERLLGPNGFHPNAFLDLVKGDR